MLELSRLMLRHLTATLLIAVVIGLCLILDNTVGRPPSGVVVGLSVASLIASWHWGNRAGLVSIGVGAVALILLLMDQRYRFHIANSDAQAMLLAFVIPSLVGNWFAVVARTEPPSHSGRRIPNLWPLGAFI